MSAGENIRADEIVLQTPDGRSLTALLTAAPIRSESGEFEWVVLTLQDLTSLEDFVRLRAEFLGTVSHELLTPLTSIKGSTTTLLNDLPGLEPPEARRFIEIIDAQADEMRDLISQLLDMARIEAGALSVNPGPADLAGLVDEARNIFLGGNEHPIEIDLGLDLPRVMADRRRIIQVLSNLFVNAAQHSDSLSAIRVTVATNELQIAVSVSDDGRGVQAQQLPDLFDRFASFDSALKTEESQGSGLGLAICKGIVEAHGGRIWAESDGPERGARFTFTLALADGSSGTNAPDRVSAPGQASTEPTCVLAVDDDPHALNVIRHTLTSLGYTAIVTSDPSDALRLIGKEKPDLVLLDLMFPGINGIELMDRILESVDLPVLFISGYRRDELIARALDQGASDYLVKPVSPTELDARIRSALRKRRAQEPEAHRSPYRSGDLLINYRERRVEVAGRPVRLAPTEYELLVELSRHAGRVLTHSLLLQRVWGMSDAGDPRFVRAAVKRLRRKLGDDAGHPRYILTERRVGYRLAAVDEDATVDS